MHSLRVRTAESARYSFGRRRAIRFLHENGRATLAELAASQGIARYRARALLFGDLPEYAPEYGLVPAGVAVAVRTALGTQFELTDAGRRDASLLVRAEEAGRRI